MANALGSVRVWWVKLVLWVWEVMLENVYDACAVLVPVAVSSVMRSHLDANGDV